MRLVTHLKLLPSVLIANSLASFPHSLRTSWPNVPFTTSGPWIVDANGAKFTYAGVNWPGASESMIPEGLQYQSIEDIVAKIKNLSMNSIRLTYATELIDQIYENGGVDIAIQTAFTDALGQENGTAILNKVMANNPSFSSNTTRLEVFNAIAAECAKQEIYVHLDNHISKAGWCCSPLDGNSWWGDNYFATTNWTRGISYMATHGKSWANLVSMSLYNELRPPLTNTTAFATYNWDTWYTNIKLGADTIHDANPDVLIFISGVNGDMDLERVVKGEVLEPGPTPFNRSDFVGYGDDKLALELHAYNIVTNVTNCSQYKADLLENGWQAMVENTTTNVFPVVMTEFGFEQSQWNDSIYATCIREFIGDIKAGWMIWLLGGSYYIREGVQDSGETWGLLTHDWSDWNSPEFVEGGLRPLVAMSLSTMNASTAPAQPSDSPNSTETTPTSSALPEYSLPHHIITYTVISVAILFYSA